MRAFIPKGWKRPIVTHDNKRTRPWSEAVVWAAREALDGAQPIDGPVALSVVFFLPRPKSTPKRVKDHIKKPDVDKLLRCISDALTRAGIYRDDAQVVIMHAVKKFGDVPGAQIVVEPVTWTV